MGKLSTHNSQRSDAKRRAEEKLGALIDEGLRSERIVADAEY
jgi:hypothetical protein